MKTIGSALLSLMDELDLLEPETLEISNKLNKLEASELLQIDSTIKLGKIKDNTETMIGDIRDVEISVNNIGR